MHYFDKKRYSSSCGKDCVHYLVGGRLFEGGLLFKEIRTSSWSVIEMMHYFNINYAPQGKENIVFTKGWGRLSEVLKYVFVEYAKVTMIRSHCYTINISYINGNLSLI